MAGREGADPRMNGLLSVPRENGETASGWVYRTLLHNLVGLVLSPGMPVSEKTIGDSLGLSRTPVREAFIRLNRDHFIDILPQKGSYVSKIDPVFIEEARFLRLCVEKEVIARACVSFCPETMISLRANLQKQDLAVLNGDPQKFMDLDDEFHFLILRGVGRETIWRLIRATSVHFDRIRLLNLTRRADWDEIVSRHRGIADAIERHDGSSAVSDIEHHLSNVLDDIEQLKGLFPDYFA